MRQKNVAIIGSGPAGLTAAIYTSRANLSTTVYLGLQPGGQLTTTTEIENFPGFPEAITGPELMERMMSQAKRFGAETTLTEVDSIEIISESQTPKFIIESEGEKKQFDAVIIATGASAKYLGLPGEQRLIGKGYHSCATCDGFFYRGKTIAVVGGGDTAAEDSTFLTKFADKVYLIHRRDELRASKIMQKRVFDNPKIEILFNTVITSLQADDKVTGVELEDTVTHQKRIMPLDAVFVAIGHTPNSKFTKNQLKTDEFGYLIPQSRFPKEDRTSRYDMMSNIHGIFLAGDIEDSVYRQAITAAGNGCKAAMECEKWLEDIEDSGLE